MTKPTNPTSRRGFSRRQLLKATGGTAALLAAAKLNFPAGAFAQGAGPEVTKAKLGFIALSDAGPLFVAKDKGFFAKYGMPDVEVAKQASWGTTRDNLVLGSEGNGIDGAHILTPMPYLISAGKVTQNNQFRRRCTSWRGSISTASAFRLPRNMPISRSASTPRRSRRRSRRRRPPASRSRPR